VWHAIQWTGVPSVIHGTDWRLSLNAEAYSFMSCLINHKTVLPLQLYVLLQKGLKCFPLPNFLDEEILHSYLIVLIFCIFVLFCSTLHLKLLDVLENPHK
jgi:hypothetical protein